MTVIIETPHADNQSPMVLFANVLTEGTLTASTEAADGAGANAVDGITSDYWTPTAMPATLTVVLGAAQGCDCGFLVAHTLGTDGATINLQSWTGSVWQTRLSHTPTDDQPILFIFDEVSSDEWRFEITGATAPSIGVAMIGKRLVFPQGIRTGYAPIYNAKEIEVLPGRSLGGHFLPSRIKRKGARGTISFAQFDRTYVEGAFEAFNIHYDEAKPFVFASGPSVFTKDVAFCRRDPGASTISPNHPNTGDLMSISLSVEAYVE